MTNERKTNITNKTKAESTRSAANGLETDVLTSGSESMGPAVELLNLLTAAANKRKGA